ncbi:MAG: glycosyltransferase family 2 protein, partial [Gemmatimonadaceae bacterium]
ADAGADVAHCGLKHGAGTLLSDLDLVIHDWTMINGPPGRTTTSWRVSLDCCLVRRDALRRFGGLDPVFRSREGAGLDLGYRHLVLGGIVEFCPALCAADEENGAEPPTEDLHAFILRHYGDRWSRYLQARRSIRHLAWRREAQASRTARRDCSALPPRGDTILAPTGALSLRGAAPPPDLAVSVVIPTLGRYGYLTDALTSLRRQTIQPREVIVVDQNPPEQRRPACYDGFEDLGLRVIWQDERGQSLARNTALAAVSSPFVFLFDDDSIAHDDLIEAHVSAVFDGRFQASTGVSLPPPPTTYQLPPRFRYPRLAQTFDTGNSMLATALAREIDGFDRNYDFGPGTDTDFGTRLYLTGVRILHNPKAVRIHFKAPAGGLRAHGAFKFNTDSGLLRPFPPVTQSYYGLRYLTRRQRRERALLQIVTSKFPSGVRVSGGWTATLRPALALTLGLLLLPLKRWRSMRAAFRLRSETPP